jgi:UDP-N-acetylmuramate dehydrogenase
MHELQMDRELMRIPGLHLQWDADMSSHTWMKTRSRAALLIHVESPKALIRLTQLCSRKGYPMLILGGGSNTVFARSYFDGIVVKLSGLSFMQKEVVAPNVVRVGASVKLTDLLSYSRNSGMMGLEFCTMIPGNVGGALAGNAGAGNWGVCDFVDRVLVLSRDGDLHDVYRNEYRYSYRHSQLAGGIILEADFRLMPINKQLSRQNSLDFAGKKKNQPYKIPNAGCIFKNPIDPKSGQKVSAGKLIDEAGLKKYKVNGIEVSDQHANFIINPGNGSGEDFLAVMRTIQDRVYDRFQIELEVEARIVGNSNEDLTNCVLC